jgi:uncharacterized protein YjiS (DUF1127 family)
MDNSKTKTRALPAAGEGATLSGEGASLKAVRQLVAWILSERRIRSGIAELRTFDDHLLADIGLTRGHIEYAARHGRPLDDRMAASARSSAEQ